jgi:predicted transcriptional regulator of viral defense system
MANQIQQAVAAIAGDGQEFFTPGDLARLLDIPQQRARELAARMEKANIARRVRRGLYALLPATDWTTRETYAVSWYATAARLMTNRPYYLAYYTAMQLHQMTQHPLRTVFVATTTRPRDRDVGPVKYRFVTLTEKRFFGFEKRRIDEGQVEVAHLERTFIDCVDRPELCGGLKEVFNGFRRRHAELNPDRLMAYLLKFDNPPAIKRLGFLLEATGYQNQPLLWDLEELARERGEYVPLERGQASGAVPIRRWRVKAPSDFRALVEQAPT